MAVFKGRGWRWPLREGDGIEVWSADHHLLGTVSATTLAEWLAHSLDGARLDARVRAELAAPAPGPAPPRKPLAGVNGHRLKGYAR